MDPDSRGKRELGVTSNSFVGRKITRRLGEPMLTPKLTAKGPKVERPPVKPPPALTPDQKRVGAILQLERNSQEAQQKLRKRGYSTQTEHEFIKLRWPRTKPMV